jgi:hypothetical protein
MLIAGLRCIGCFEVDNDVPVTVGVPVNGL